MEKALISVIIPVYNTGKYLRPCLDSIVGQTYRNLEILLIDDGSKDDSYAVCREYAERDKRVTAIHKENGGVSSARNLGLRMAHGEWFSFIDSDDYLETNAYELLLGLIEQNPCDAITFESFVTYGSVDKPHRLPNMHSQLLNRQQSMKLLHAGAPFTVTRLFGRKLVEGLQFDETIARGEDGIFNTQALHRAERVYYTDMPLYHYVQSEDSAVRGAFRPSQLTAMKLPDFYVPFFSEHYPELLPSFYYSMGHILTDLYYCMNVEKKYPAEQKEVLQTYRKLYPRMSVSKRPLRYRIKLRLFRYIPKLYCRLHHERVGNKERKNGRTL